MKSALLLHLSAIETDGKLSIAVSLGVSDANGQECRRTTEMSWDTVEQTHCPDCWLEDVLNTVVGEHNIATWVYTHGPGCEASHKEDDHA